MQKVCLIVGAGSGIGGTTAKLFAQNGYHSVLCRRSDQAGLDELCEAIRNDGGKASGFLVDISQENSIENLVSKVESEIGPIHVAIYNLGAQIGNRSVDETTIKQFSLGWQLGTFGLFRLAKSLLPQMETRQEGMLSVTSSTAALRGNKGQHSHTAAMGGRRMLCQSLNHEYASKGIHIAHLYIDSAVDSPDTLGKMLGDSFKPFRDKLQKDQAITPPLEVAKAHYYLAQQSKSAWSFEMDIRTHKDVCWWNS